MRRPFFRSSTLSWYVETESSKQIPLGRDERFKTVPKEKPKEARSHARKRLLQAI